MRAALRAPLRGEVLHVENDGFHVRHLAHLLQHPRVKFLPAADAIASSRRAREYSRLGEGTELRLERREGPLCPAVYNTSSLTALPAPPRSTPTLLPSFVCLCCFHCSHPSSPTLCRGYRRGNAPRSRDASVPHTSKTPRLGTDNALIGIVAFRLRVDPHQPRYFVYKTCYRLLYGRIGSLQTPVSKEYSKIPAVNRCNEYVKRV